MKGVIVICEFYLWLLPGLSSYFPTLVCPNSLYPKHYYIPNPYFLKRCSLFICSSFPWFAFFPSVWWIHLIIYLGFIFSHIFFRWPYVISCTQWFQVSQCWFPWAFVSSDFLFSVSSHQFTTSTPEVHFHSLYFRHTFFHKITHNLASYFSVSIW